ncbi:metal ABC transporter permease [Corynebacterium cystitidis]|uniref:metal ABC transporter permease n=1 Tax=Corynebacterium cystitidis TaxID=35757 RepID=UPI00211EEEB6|nr:metal ABC transporter permease [Corynebacterium cystitidis]
MSIFMATLMLTIITALACAVPGVFVVLRKHSMLVDAIGHAAFPGIIVGFTITGNLDSPWLIVGAAVAGLVVVWGAEWLYSTGLITRDASQGLLFPALFAVGVIIVSARFSNMHLDTHTVLVGDLNLAAFDRLIIGSYDFGPRYFYVMALVLLINVLFLALTLRQLTAATFDPDFAKVVGIPTRMLAATFMFLVAVTVVAAFHAAGALLVLSLIVAPAASASLICKRIPYLIAMTVVIAAAGGVVGFIAAYVFDLATSATLAVFYALIFVCVITGNRVIRARASRQAQEAPTYQQQPSQPL